MCVVIDLHPPPPPVYTTVCQRCPQGTVAGSGTNILSAFTTRKQARQKGKISVCVTYTRGNIHPCVYENQGSCMFRYSKVCTTRIRSSLPYHIDRQNAMCATYMYANTDSRIFRNGNGDTHACLTHYTRMKSDLLLWRLLRIQEISVALHSNLCLICTVNPRVCLAENVPTV